MGKAVKPQGRSEAMTPGSRPLQLLELLATQNMTLYEAASHLNISVSTANQHVAAAKRALNARTTTAAVVEAVRRGLIAVKT